MNKNKSKNKPAVKIYSCVAEKMLDTSTLLKVDGYYLHNWDLENIADLKNLFEEDGIALIFSYTDDEGYIFEYEFEVKALENAKIFENCIKMIDTKGDEFEIKCFNLVPNCK